MELWIGLTVAGAAVNNVRAILQRHQTVRLSVTGAAYARFLYGLPLAWIAVFAAASVQNSPLPAPNASFFGFVAVGGLAHVLGGTLYVYLIQRANFTVITTYIKTETVTAALFSFVILGDTFSVLGLGGIAVAFFGVMVLSAGQSTLTLRSLVLSVSRRDALMG
ncbi:MAG: EamA family transporter, partial [Rhodospirillaceae bacterium]